jgi:hypothetical protein
MLCAQHSFKAGFGSLGGRQSGDAKLAVNLYVAGWITQRGDFESCWRGCTSPEAGERSAWLPGFRA